MNRRTFVQAAAAALPLVSPSWVTRAIRADGVFVERWSWAMGQPVHLRLFAPSHAEGLEAAQLALAELRRVEACLSLFDDASDLSELNRRAGRAAMPAGPDLLAVLRAARYFRRESRGAFDVAVEPLMRAWGFHRPRSEPPGPAELRAALAAVRAAEIRIEGRRVSLPASHTRLDLGGIAVGYGLDRMAMVLRSRGIARALLEVSGDLLALGPPPGLAGWPVEIADPDQRGRFRATVPLAGAALATSSNAVSIVQLAGVVRGHVMNPASGYPADRVRQATALASTGLAADALSTAMLVAGRRLPGVRQGWLVQGR